MLTSRWVWSLLVVSFLYSNLLFATQSSDALVKYQEEELYWSFRQEILNNQKSIFSEQKDITLWVNALEDLYFDMIDNGSSDNSSFRTIEDKSQNMQSFLKNNKGLEASLQIEELLRLKVLSGKVTKKETLDNLFLERVKELLIIGEASKRLKILVGNLMWIEKNSKVQLTLEETLNEVEPELKNILTKGLSDLSTSDIRDLFYHIPDWATIMGGQYQGGIKIYMFCRHDRNYPCLMVGKDQFDLPIMSANQKTLWHQKALASSSRGLPSSVRNGQTPAGVQKIDSVMPEANRQDAFGKFRRIILNWLPQNQNTVEEIETLNLLPSSQHTKTWWKQALVSRDVGRTDLRIHGTGRINDDPLSSFFPFRKTSGCISQREGTYAGYEYHDQRILLDTLMDAMGLEQLFVNETQLKGILYLVELDDKKTPVTIEELEKILREDNSDF